MDSYEAVFPAPEVKGKRGRGRPRVDLKEVAALYNFPPGTKLEMLERLYEGPLKDGCGWFNCKRCMLGESREVDGRGQDIVFFTGNPNADVLIIGEAPGATEEREKQAFIGPAGKLLNIILATVSDDPEIQELAAWYAKERHTDKTEETFHTKVLEWRGNEFGITNVVSCEPPDDRQPSVTEMKACWERLWNIIYIVDPMLIIACGNTALSQVARKVSAQITKVRGQIHDVTYDGKVGRLTYPMMPVLHPSFLSRQADWKLKDGWYAKSVDDWRKAMRMVDMLRHANYGTPIPHR